MEISNFIFIYTFLFLTLSYPSKQSSMRSTYDVDVVAGWVYPYSSFSVKVHRSKTLALSPKVLSMVFSTVDGVMVSISFTPLHYLFRLPKSHCLLEIQILTARTCQHTIFCMTSRLSTNRRYFPLLSPPFAHQSSGQTMSFEKTQLVPHSVVDSPTTYCLYGFYPVAFYMRIANVLYLLLFCR